MDILNISYLDDDEYEPEMNTAIQGNSQNLNNLKAPEKIGTIFNFSYIMTLTYKFLFI